MHPGWLSNAYLVADEEGGAAVFVDTGAPLGPLFEAAERWRVQPTHVLRTHADPDHIEHEERAGPARWSPARSRWVGCASRRCRRRVTRTTTSRSSSVTRCFSGDVLFKDAVGGGDPEQMRDSVMRLMELPHETRVLPGHTDETTIGREWEENPFVRV